MTREHLAVLVIAVILCTLRKCSKVAGDVDTLRAVAASLATPGQEVPMTTLWAKL